MTAHLVVVDMQHVFADPDGPWGAPRFAETVDPVTRLVRHFEPAVTFTRFVAPERPSGAWRDYYREFPFALVGADDPMYALVEPFRGRPTLDATTFGKWGDELAARTDDGLVVAGVSTECCVLATVLAAADAGVHVQVAVDACAGAGDDAHAAALSVMASFAPLVELAEVDTILGA